MPHLLYILFLFALGACVGSFLNVVVWRLPRIEYGENDTGWRALLRSIEGLSNPPSHCPKCKNRLKWYDNVPVLGWLKLGGKCRFCGLPISPRYPIVEAVTGLLFAGYYVAFFIYQAGPCPEVMTQTMNEYGEWVNVPTALNIAQHWPIYFLFMFAISCLLAASLIDAELFIIPLEIPWLMAVVGIVVHALIDRPTMPGSLNLPPMLAAVAMGAGIGLAISMMLWWLGRMPTSFPQGEPMLEIDHAAFAKDVADARAAGQPEPTLPPAYTPAQIRREMGKEILFLGPPMLLAILSGILAAGPMADRFEMVAKHHWFTGLLGAVWGGCVGAFTVWFFRIAGTVALGRVAMGLGDVHLMFGVGAILGAFGSFAAFFLAPFFAIVLHVWLLLLRKQRELPYGPYLSLATAFVMVFSCPIAAYLMPGFAGLLAAIQMLLGWEPSPGPAVVAPL
jgi:leader peptidase (prepilin peptidase)/N-methyltransferase